MADKAAQHISTEARASTGTGSSSLLRTPHVIIASSSTHVGAPIAAGCDDVRAVRDPGLGPGLGHRIMGHAGREGNPAVSNEGEEAGMRRVSLHEDRAVSRVWHRCCKQAFWMTGGRGWRGPRVNWGGEELSSGGGLCLPGAVPNFTCQKVGAGISNFARSASSPLNLDFNRAAPSKQTTSPGTRFLALHHSVFLLPPTLCRIPACFRPRSPQTHLCHPPRASLQNRYVAHYHMPHLSYAGSIDGCNLPPIRHR